MVALLALCLPTLLFVWFNRDVPHFGVLQDDGLYFIAGKTLAQNSSYQISSLPGKPEQTKYPPLYPLLLSVAWKMNPAYPANLAIALLLSWLSLPLVLVLAYRWCFRQGFQAPLVWLVVGLFACNPYVLFFVSNLGSEMLFMAFLFGAMLVAETKDETGWRMALLAGVIAGAGYLARTSGIALLPAAIAYYFWKKQARRGLWFSVGMLPAIVGWALWSRLHAPPGQDIVTICYTDYLGYQFLNVGWDNIVHVLLRNSAALLEAMGSLVFPQMMDGWLAKVLLWPLALAMIVGCVRLIRQGYARLYALFSLVSAAMLLAWHYQPNQRFILPLAPLLMAGFCFAMVELAKWIQQQDRGLAVRGLAIVWALVLTGGLVLQMCMDVGVLPQLARNDRLNARAYQSMYAWIARNLPAEANILWQDDTALYLATGRHSVSYVVPPREFEATGGDAGEALRFGGIDRYAREQHLGYVLLAKVGLRRNEAVLKVAAADAGLELVHEEAGGVLYRVR
ncbi:MAG: hypothetical protein M3N41_08950 [Acidobacteriota bacterium]|nr:hypothetical protein [Acidobacteriota bacterium]